jgi:predicted Rossmann fold nucleotide-binding protein DprA/Smf involved in DNA uptake
MTDLAAWMALAYRTSIPSAELMAIALGEGPCADDFPAGIYEGEAVDLAALEELGVTLVPISDAGYPERLRGEGAPILLQVKGRVALLDEEGVEFVPGYRGAGGRALQEALEQGGRAVVVLSKGLLKARSLMRALHEPIEEGSIALLSAEPPRAAWGPVRDRRRDALVEGLRR